MLCNLVGGLIHVIGSGGASLQGVYRWIKNKIVVLNRVRLCVGCVRLGAW